MVNGAGRSTSGQLDRDISVVVRRYLEITDGATVSDSMLALRVYKHIKDSNSSLARLKKEPLMSSIDRVLIHMNNEAAQDNSDVQETNEYTSTDPPFQETDQRLMNQVILQTYRNNKKQISEAKTTSHPTKHKSVKRKRESSNGHAEMSREPSIALNPSQDISITDLGGISEILALFLEASCMLLADRHTTNFHSLESAQLYLLHGASGCGKTSFAMAFGKCIGIPFITVNAHQISAGGSESEQILKEHLRAAEDNDPCILLIDQIDIIAPKRDGSSRDVDKRAQMALIDWLHRLKGMQKRILIIATTNNLSGLDPAIRRACRTTQEVEMHMPDAKMREEILSVLTEQLSMSQDIDLSEVARRTPAFVGKDLEDLVAEAKMQRNRRLLQPSLTYARPSDAYQSGDRAKDTTLRYVETYKREALQSKTFSNPDLNHDDFLQAMRRIKPAAAQEGFNAIPSTTWDNIGALSGVRKVLNANIIQPMLRPGIWEAIGMTPPKGVLLWGPPGCGKTLLAKAVANQTKAHFISVKGPELFSKFVGDSERLVRELFARARACAPCLIFFDEIDALAPKRDGSLHEASSRVVNTLLVELDGLDSGAGVHVLGATNMPDRVDGAMLRPGRFGTFCFVALPTAEERVDILRTLTRSLRMGDFLDDMDAIARDCEGFSGADMSGLVTTACTKAIEAGNDSVSLADFTVARQETQASVRNYSQYLALVGKLNRIK